MERKINRSKRRKHDAISGNNMGEVQEVVTPKDWMTTVVTTYK